MGQAANVQKPFLTDVKTLRERARSNLNDGAIGSNYVGDVNKTIEILQSVLATEFPTWGSRVQTLLVALIALDELVVGLGESRWGLQWIDLTALPRALGY